MRMLLMAFVTILCGIIPAFSADVPAHRGFVTDDAGLLTPLEIEALGTRLKAIQDGSPDKSQVVILTVKDMGGEEVVPFSQAVFHEWGIGQQGKDNGVLILVAMDERKVRVHVGYGLEGAIPDATAKKILGKMTPALKSKDYGAAFSTAIDELQPLIMREQVPAAASTDDDGIGGFVIVLIVLLTIGAVVVYVTDPARGMPKETRRPVRSGGSPRSYSPSPASRRPRRASDDDDSPAVAGAVIGGGSGDGDRGTSSNDSFSGGGGDSGGGGADGSF